MSSLPTVPQREAYTEGVPTHERLAFWDDYEVLRKPGGEYH